MPDVNTIADDDIELKEAQDTEQSVGISDEQISDIEEALHVGYEDALIDNIYQLSPADGAELIAKVSEEDRDLLLKEHAHAFPPVFFSHLDKDLRKVALSNMDAENVAAILSELESDDALSLIVNLEPEFQNEIILKLSSKIRLTLQEGLSFPEESAGRLMQREFVAIPQFWTVGKTIDYLRAAAATLPEDFFDIFVISPTYHVVGEIPLSRILRSERSKKVEDLKLEALHAISALTDQEDVARLFKREDLISAPVVDAEDRLIGVITVDDVVDVLDDEAQEDLLKLAGVEKGDLYRAVMSTTGSRFKWLFVNLLTAIMASVVISLFDATLEQMVAVAILMPIVASMGGNAGTQALTVAVRALATRELSGANALRVIWKETIVGILNGGAFAVIMGVIAALWFANIQLGGVIAIAMIVNLIVAGLFGAGIPIVINRLGGDPAVSSTVFLTTLTDVIGFLVFLGLAALVLV